MPAARQRPLEDSRSETSSTVTNIKERSSLIPGFTSSISKGKRSALGPSSGSSTIPKTLVNGIATAPAEPDPNLPRTDWQTIGPRILHTYRHAYHLDTPSAYTHPHADLIYRSSRTAKRSPSMVYARHKIRDLKNDRRKPPRPAPHKQKERLPARSPSPISPPSSHSQQQAPQPAPFRQPPASLALALRRHFNNLSSNESEMLTRFLYVVHHSSTSFTQSPPRTLEGSDGDGRGNVIGSQGREVMRNDGAGGGGDLGFRLRFRPELR